MQEIRSYVTFPEGRKLVHYACGPSGSLVVRTNEGILIDPEREYALEQKRSVLSAKGMYPKPTQSEPAKTGYKIHREKKQHRENPSKSEFPTFMVKSSRGIMVHDRVTGVNTFYKPGNRRYEEIEKDFLAINPHLEPQRDYTPRESTYDGMFRAPSAAEMFRRQFGRELNEW